MTSAMSVKQHFRQLLDAHSEVNPYELRHIFTEAIRDRELELGWDESAKREPWTDDQLRVVLSDAPTKENCLKHARAFARGYGAIEQIYRWAATTDKQVKTKRPDDAFVAQIKRVAKELGWRA